MQPVAEIADRDALSSVCIGVNEGYLVISAGVKTMSL
jgi:hypothetical protein